MLYSSDICKSIRVQRMGSVLLLALLCLSSTAWGQQEERPLAPFFTGDSLPTPPQQYEAWTHGDDALSQAAAKLFEQGLADPRGLEYREIEIAVGDPLGGGGRALKTHGWAFPEEPGRGQFAVAWNGLIYPAVHIGGLADLHADWESAATTLAVIEKNGRWREPEVFEHSSVQVIPQSALRLVLLLRLGEVEIVNRFSAKMLSSEAPDPYLELATDWAWFAFERGTCAHMRGDDRLCLVDTRLLTRIQPLIEAEALRRGFRQQTDDSDSRFPDRKLPYLPFLKQLQLLLADCERRLAPEQPPLVKNHIAALIDDLQNVNERQRSEPGGVSLALDPRVQVLVQQGNEIVEPLLNAFENDMRLTRSVSFGRSFHRQRHLISVSAAAFATLRDFLQMDFRTYDRESGVPFSKREVVQQIRAYWTRMSDLPPAERFYATLKDDAADPAAWLQAAGYLVQPTDVERHGAWTITPERKPGQKIMMRGESLRDERMPSISELMAKRSDDMAAIRTHSSNDSFLYWNAGEMAIALAKWDPTAAIPVLKRRLDRAWSIGAEPNDILAFNHNPTEFFASIIAQMTLTRVRCGDESAYDEYAAWIRKANLHGVGFAFHDLQRPLLEGSKNPRIADAIDFVFNDPSSPWSNVLDTENRTWLRDFWESPWPMTTAFYRQALRGLDNTSDYGTIKCAARTDGNGGYLSVQFPASGFGLGNVGDDPEAPQPGEERAFRVCDAYAYFYSEHQNGPKFQLYWTEEKRDAGIEACRQWLQTNVK